MTDPMATPVTKREMQSTFDAFLAVLMERLDKRFEQIDKRFEQARIEMVATVDAMADTLRAEMRALSQANIEAVRLHISALDDKYRDTPARLDAVEGRFDALEHRVTKLETQKRQRRR